MAPFDRSYTTFYWSAIVSIALSGNRFWVIWRWMISWPWNLGWRSLKVIQVGTVRKLGCGFLFAFHSNCGSVLHYLRDKARYWSKIVIFFKPFCNRRFVRGVPVGILPSCLVWKTWMVWLPDGEKTLSICITVLAQYRRVTDGQTDGLTSGHGIVRTMHTRSAVKMKPNL